MSGDTLDLASALRSTLAEHPSERDPLRAAVEALIDAAKDRGVDASVALLEAARARLSERDAIRREVVAIPESVEHTPRQFDPTLPRLVDALLSGERWFVESWLRLKPHEGFPISHLALRQWLEGGTAAVACAIADALGAPEAGEGVLRAKLLALRGFHSLAAMNRWRAAIDLRLAQVAAPSEAVVRCLAAAVAMARNRLNAAESLYTSATIELRPEPQLGLALVAHKRGLAKDAVAAIESAVTRLVRLHRPLDRLRGAMAWVPELAEADALAAAIEHTFAREVLRAGIAVPEIDEVLANVATGAPAEYIAIRAEAMSLRAAQPDAPIEAAFHAAEALRLQAKSEADHVRVIEALDAALARRPPDRDLAWPLVARSLATERLSTITKRRELLADALVYAEWVAIISPVGHHYALLSRLYHSASALFGAEKLARVAVEKSPRAHQPHEDLAAALGSLGRYDECLETIAKRLELSEDDPGSWLRALRGYCLTHLRRDGDALALLESSVGDQPWVRPLLADCLRRSKRLDDARREYETADRSALNLVDYAYCVGWLRTPGDPSPNAVDARLREGGELRKELDSLVDDSLHPFDIAHGQAMCRIMALDFDVGQPLFVRALDHAYFPRQLDDLDDQLVGLAEWVGSSEVERRVDGLRHLLAAARAGLGQRAANAEARDDERLLLLADARRGDFSVLTAARRALEAGAEPILAPLDERIATSIRGELARRAVDEADSNMTEGGFAEASRSFTKALSFAVTPRAALGEMVSTLASNDAPGPMPAFAFSSLDEHARASAIDDLSSHYSRPEKKARAIELRSALAARGSVAAPIVAALDRAIQRPIAVDAPRQATRAIRVTSDGATTPALKRSVVQKVTLSARARAQRALGLPCAKAVIVRGAAASAPYIVSVAGVPTQLPPRDGLEGDELPTSLESDLVEAHFALAGLRFDADNLVALCNTWEKGEGEERVDAIPTEQLEDLWTSPARIGSVSRVLRRLIAERIPLANGLAVVEALRRPISVLRAVHAVQRRITRHWFGADRRFVTLETHEERLIRSFVELDAKSAFGVRLTLEPDELDLLLRGLRGRATVGCVFVVRSPVVRFVLPMLMEYEFGTVFAVTRGGPHAPG